MEGMQQFYLNATLEADFAVAREKLVGQQAMKYDPRISTPFESREILASVSSHRIIKYTINLIIHLPF